MDINYITNKINNRDIRPLGIKKDFAVLVPLINVDGEIHILYEIRSKTLSTQPGEISFPGGRVESGETFKEASIRETCEELNVSMDDIDMIGELDYIVMPFNISIYPYVGVLKNIDLKKIKGNIDEVEDVFTVPIKFFLENEPIRHDLYINPEPDESFPYHLIQNGKAYDWRKGIYPVYFYKYKEYIIWGITARITKNFIDIIRNT